MPVTQAAGFVVNGVMAVALMFESLMVHTAAVIVSPGSNQSVQSNA